ncbi:hypothetical protein [Pseudonocardia kunmingensis]|uniref:Uncharacterized protein n=1 Tax=Pseudonocardia kunmingensis TaxID=630975 RepID=A0A543E3A3_9PSEU|nr:hypothetical protein [Pseudonocardia kunmingensis]TQM16068.1 hypothetical protein FB558_2871 [Pseudonocardia kunmingensis]
MLEVGPDQDGEDDADLAVFVDRLAAAGSDQPTTDAQTQIRRAIAAGASPPGLRRLAEALAASVAELPPPPRRPAEDPASVVAAMRDNALVVLEDFDTAAAAAAVAALLADGRRVIVTGATPAEVAAVRAALPPEAADRALPHLPTLTPAELRELRRLLATSTPERRARGAQELPPENALPDPADVAALCAEVARHTGEDTGAWMVPTLLADLDEGRRAAVTSVARCVHRSLGSMPGHAGSEWTWRLLSELIYGRRRAEFDQLVEDTSRVSAALDRTRSDPPVSFSAAPPPDTVAVLLRYREFLAGGGRTRAYFRSAAQREVQPVLEKVRVGDRHPETEADVDRVLEYLELVDRQAQVDAACAELGVPVPRDADELAEVSDGLAKVAAAARSVGALRHDVLFLAPDSPLAVPDLETAEEIALAIIEYADHGSAVAAARRLDALADALAQRSPVPATAPELEQAVTALRDRDAEGYAAAVEALGAARREVRDETQCAELLERLRNGAPRLAEAWSALAERDPTALGLASFVPVAPLLSALPAPDSADIVLVLGARGLGVERLLLAAVAPRLVAVVGPGDERDDPPSMVDVLQRASALVIRGRATRGRVLPFNGSPPRSAAPVGQAGA